MRKMSWLMILLSVILLLSACANGPKNSNDSGNKSSGADPQVEQGKTYKIGISQYLEHPSLDATREGFLDALKDAGIEQGVNLEIDYNTAQADSTNNNSIATKLASGDHDLILAIATPSAIAVAQQIQDKPILFAAVTDPLDARLVESLEKPGFNVTGASDTNPDAINMLMDFIAEHVPDVKKVGLIINTGEPNAVIMAQTAEDALAEHGIELVRAAVTNTSEVQQAAQSLVGEVDAFYITLDNSVVSAVSSILQIAEAEGIPLFSSDRDTVEAGAVATYGFKYYDHGYQAGEMALKILLDGADPAEMPVSKPDKLNLILNKTAAEAQGFEITDEILNKVTDPEENLIE